MINERTQLERMKDVTNAIKEQLKNCSIIFEEIRRDNSVIAFDSHDISLHTLQMIRDSSIKSMDVEVVVGLDTTFIMVEQSFKLGDLF